MTHTNFSDLGTVMATELINSLSPQGGSHSNLGVHSMYLLQKFNIASVTRLCVLLDFGQLLKPLAIIYLSKSFTFLGNFC